MLRQHPGLQDHEFVFRRAWLKDTPTEDQVARCRVLVYQDSFGLPAFMDLLPEQAWRLHIPLVTCAFLWPFSFDRPNEPVGWRFPYGDRYLIGKIREGLAPEAAAAEYIALDLAQRMDLRRLWDMEVQKWQAYDAKTDIRLADFLRDNFFSQRLFFTPDHPSDQVMLEMVNQLLMKLQLPILHLPSWEGHVHSLGGTEVPVHPSVIRHFALSWLTPEHAYPMYGGNLALGAHETYLRYATALRAPSMAEGLQEAAAAIQRGDDRTALNICTLIRQRSPQHPWALAATALLLAVNGQREQAVQFFSAALAAEAAAG